MRVVLLGHPVAHSLSPAMQNAAFGARGMDHRYEAIDVEPDSLADAVMELRDRDVLGANITVPYKLAVVPALDAVDAEAQTLGAVNTIVNTGGRLSGYNTDVDGAWEGLLAPVLDSIRGAKVLVIGAGGGAGRCSWRWRGACRRRARSRSRCWRGALTRRRRRRSWAATPGCPPGPASGGSCATSCGRPPWW